MRELNHNPPDWVHTELGRLIVRTRLGITERGCKNESDCIILVKMGNLDWGKIDLRDAEKVDVSKVDRDQDILQDGELLFNTRNTPALVGKSAVWTANDTPAVADNNINRIRFSELVDPHFVCAVMNNGEGKARIHALAAGSTSVAAIYWKDITHFKLTLPSLPEQRKIVEILRSWDEAIEKADRLIDLRARQYLGLRCALIDWSVGNQTDLRTFLKPVSRPIPKPKGPYRALSIRSHGKGTFDRVVEKPDDVDMDTLYVAKAGDIIVNITFAWEGAIALVPSEHDGGLVSHRFPTFVPIADRANERYLRHTLRMSRFTYLLGVVSPGGAGRNRVLSKGDFLDLEIPLPKLTKQTRIATILDDAENAIAGEIRFKDALIRQKRGLMQKLLTGEWRVRVDAAKEAAA